jgi:signal transduction histidine kinase
VGRVQPDHVRRPGARIERWGRRAALAGFGFLLLIDALAAVANAASEAQFGHWWAWPQSAALLVTDVVLLVLAFRAGDPWRRCLTAAVVSLTVSGVLLAVPGDGGGGLVEQAALWWLLLLGVRTLPRWRSWVAVILITAAMAVEPMRWGRAGPFFTFVGVLIATMVVAAGLYLRGLDERRDRAVVDVRRAERLQLARELHDFVAHHVTGIVVGAQAAQVVAARDPQRALASLSTIEAAGLETLASMRRLVGMMREEGDGAATQPGADGAALRELVAGFSRTGPPVRFRADDAIDHAPPDVALSAHRIVLEALTNVRRHAVGVSRVDVDVRRTAGGLLIVVRDDGRGSNGHPAGPRGGAGGGFGLIGLTERADAVGGRFSAGPHAAGGWEVTALLPVTQTA